MSAAALVAAAAGGVAALGIGELARGWERQRRPPRRVKRLALAALTGAGRGMARRAPRDLTARIEAAGVGAEPGDVMAIKAGGALAALLASLPAASALPGRAGLLTTAAAAAAAFLVPDAWLRRRTRARARAMEAELADVLDLLRVAVAAGLTARRALAELGRRHPGVLAGELRRTARQMDLGCPPDEALAVLERRCPTPAIPPLVAALDRAARHGAPLATTLAAQAADARARQARDRAEAAARAGPKIQLVVALLLVPSVLLLVAAALLPA
jgi:tight adherence protein C